MVKMTPTLLSIHTLPADSPIYYLPLVMLVGVGGVLIGLLVFKKRDKIEAR